MKRFRLLAPIISALALALVLGGQAQAADYSNSHLMDDQVFDNVGSLTQSQIDDFLQARTGPFTKLGTASPCLSGYSSINFRWDGTDWYYGDSTRKGNSTGWTSQSFAWNTAWGPANIPASQVIYKSAQMWGLNPEVLISTLQKEESLITGTSCDTWRYNSAMGYGCPDSGGCSASYAGFSRQVLWGGWQLKFSKERSLGNTAWDDDGSITYGGYMTQGNRARRAGGTVNYYDGYATIDGQSIFLENGTTASLYTYTPHLGQSFPGIFEGWFGSVVIPTYSWQYAGQTSSKNLGSLPVGQKATFTVSAKNVGSATWTNSGSNPVHLGTSHPQDRSSRFNTSGWLSPARAANMNEASVAPGQTATFTFVIQAPNAPGSYNEYFNLLAEGITWMNDPGLYYGITVVSPSLNGSLISSTVPGNINTDATQSATITVRNDGNVTWYKDGSFPINLGTYDPGDRTSQFQAPGWVGATRLAHMNEASVDPGSNATFTFDLKAPHVPGNYTESYSLVADGLAWFNQAITKAISVKGTFTASAQSNTSVSIIAGQSQNVTLSFVNTGTATWSNSGANPVKLGTTSPQDRTSQFCDSSWLGCNRPDLLNEATVAPGATGTFTFTIKTNPVQFGAYNEDFLPVAEGQEWFGAPSRVTINVAPSTYSWAVSGQEAYADSGKTQPVDLMNLSPGQTAWLVLKAKNTGNVTWQKAGSNPVHLGTESPKDRTSLFATSAWLGQNRPAALAESSVAPNAIGTFEFPVKVPARGGNYFERFNLVAEGVAWMNDTGLGYSMKINNGYSWSLAGQEAYTDAGFSAPANLANLSAGSVTYWRVRAKNTGSATWLNSGDFPLDLGTTHAMDHTSAFCNSSDAPTWLGCNRPARLKEASVAPGATGTFEFSTKAPAAGTYHEYFNPVAEGITWLNDPGMNFYSVVH